ncbi:MAG: tetratricopeptide repeat protein [Candidatus Aquicultorales bacterium]
MKQTDDLLGKGDEATEDKTSENEVDEAKQDPIGDQAEDRQEETVSVWLAGSVILALIAVFLLSGLIIKSLYVEQPVARTAVERDIFKYRELSQKNPKDVNSRIALADAYIEAKEYEAAERELKSLIELSPRNPQPHERLAEIHRINGKMDQAIVEYKKAVELDPRDEIAYYQLGQIYMAKNDFIKARDAYRRLVQINPSVADGHYYLALASEKLADKETARTHYREALKYIPDYSEAKDGLDRVSE